MLQIKNLSLALGGKELFKNLNLTILGNDKIGIIGVNGSGKSSLLKCIVGELEPDLGNVEIRGTYAYLAQETHKSEKSTNNLNASTSEDADDALTIEEYFVLHNNIDIEPWEIQKFMNFMNMTPHTPDSLISELSGGQKVKVDIIKLLVQKPDLLILDEPTNFLDIPTAEWLMKYLVGYEKALLVVSHDLRLMNRSLTRVWFLDELNKSVTVYNGNYDKFIKMKAAQDEWLVHQIQKQEKMAKDMANSAAIISKRGATKEKMKAARKREVAEKLAEEAQQLSQKLQKSKKINIKFDLQKTSSINVLKAVNISKNYKAPVLNDVKIEIERGDKVVIIGKNGAGKTTLLKILSGSIKPDSGDIKWGHNVDIGYYAQEYEGLEYSETVLENLTHDDRIRVKGEQYCRKVLGSFLFSGDTVEKQVKVLSGGEKTRLAMAKIIAGGYNTLLLDEPTTYLDPKSIDIVETALIDYPGTLLLVSHDPSFVSKISPDKALLMPEEKFTHFSKEYLARVGIT